jgi:hypothetical protein
MAGNKKVGILTYHYIYNYGAQLQAYCTVMALRKLGFDPIILHYVHKDVLEQKYKKHVSAEQQAVHNAFAEEFLPLSTECNSKEDIVNLVDHMGLQRIIVGSDAVFLITQGYNVFTNTTHPTIYWMGWVRECNHYENIKIYGLSVSAMDTNFTKLPAAHKKELRQNLDLFNKVYYRDLWARLFIKFLRPLKKIARTPDPVLAFNLLAKQELMEKTRIPVEGKYILYGFGLTDGRKHHDKLEAMKKEANMRGFKFIDLPFPEGNYNELSDEKFNEILSPLQWYKLIANASGYIGEKFHPVIIAIHNKVSFFGIDRNADRVSTKFKIPIRLKFQSKTWDTCRYYGFKDAYVPLSEFGKTSPQDVMQLLLDKKWNFKKVEKVSHKFIKAIKSFNM